MLQYALTIREEMHFIYPVIVGYSLYTLYMKNKAIVGQSVPLISS